MSRYITYQALKVSAGSIVMYNRYEEIEAPKYKRQYNVNNLAKGTPKGELSKKNGKRIREMVVNLHAAINRNTIKKQIQYNVNAKPLSFITLTLSEKQKHPDKWIKRHMLDRFVITLNRANCLHRYIWKAEAQKNGNLHFHIITPDYIKKEYIQKVWNKIQYECGYLDTYIHFHKHKNAPSTEIKACKNIRHTAGYAAKYIAKEENSRLIEGRVWGCSDRLRSMKTPTVMSDKEIQDVLTDAVRSGELILKELEHCNIYIGDIYKLMQNKSYKLQKYYCNEVQRNWLSINDEMKINYVNTEIKSNLQCVIKPTQLKLWENN